MLTLASAIGLVEGEAARWLNGGPVRQGDLRRRVEQANPRLARLQRTTYDMLSDQVHGRTQSLFVYENVRGEFDWPPHGDTVDPRRIRSACALILGSLLAHFGTLHWYVREWTRLPSGVDVEVTTFYAALTDFVLTHLAHGEWTMIAPGHAAAWLGIATAADGD